MRGAAEGRNERRIRLIRRSDFAAVSAEDGEVFSRFEHRKAETRSQLTLPLGASLPYQSQAHPNLPVECRRLQHEAFQGRCSGIPCCGTIGDHDGSHDLPCGSRGCAAAALGLYGGPPRLFRKGPAHACARDGRCGSRHAPLAGSHVRDQEAQGYQVHHECVHRSIWGERGRASCPCIPSQLSLLPPLAVIGAGPIVIGQACEFDYSGTQACKSLK